MALKRIRRFQDGHSPSEQVVYLALYRRTPPGTESRIATGGYRTIAAQTSLDPSTVKKCLAALEAKGSIEKIKPAVARTSTGATYRVYSFAEILQRWRECGFTHVDRSHGVRLVRSEENGGHADSEVSATSPATPPRPQEPTGAVRQSPRAPVGGPDTPLGMKKQVEESTTSLTRRIELQPWAQARVGDVRDKLANHFGHHRGLPDSVLVTRVIENFKDEESLEAWLSDVGYRVIGARLRSWGFYLTDAEQFSARWNQAKNAAAAEAAKHAANCMGATFVPCSPDGVHNVVYASRCGTCKKGELASSEELDRLAEEDARSRGPGWYGMREATRLGF